MRGLSYLNLQKIIPANILVVHLMVGIVCITTALIFNKGKARYCLVMDRCERDFTKRTVGWKHFWVLECHSGQDVHSWYFQSAEAQTIPLLVPEGP